MCLIGLAKLNAKVLYHLTQTVTLWVPLISPFYFKENWKKSTSNLKKLVNGGNNLNPGYVVTKTSALKYSFILGKKNTLEIRRINFVIFKFHFITIIIILSL